MKNHYKFWIALSLIVIFAAGVLGGMLLEKNLTHKKFEKRDKRRSSVRFPSMEDMAVELNLIPEQQEKIKEVFRNNEERFKTLRKDINVRLKNMRSQLKEEINSILTEEQAQKFDAMIKKYISQRKKEADRRKEHSDKRRKDKKEEENHSKRRSPR
ncbi:MAG: hypothetical protein PVI11_05305 [Candidatus Aminicenantes bacterium]|jgi:hypothetical protein